MTWKANLNSKIVNTQTMMSKKKKVYRNFAEKAYKSTQLDHGYTEAKIRGMLMELGINDIRITQVGNDYHLEFLVKLQFNEAPRKVRIDIPFTPELEDTVKQKKRKKDALFRVAFYHLKDKFVAVYNGLKEFEEEFLADLVIVHEGREQRLGDVIVPKYKAQLKNSKVAILKISN